MKKNYLVSILLLSLFSGKTFAQTQTLLSPCIGTFSRSAYFFDLQATNNIVLNNFSVMSQNCGTRDISVYYKTGTYLGFNSNPNAWTLLGSVSTFTPNCTIACPIPPTMIPVDLNLCLTAGQTYGFYIVTTAGAGTLESHNTLPSGSIAVQDANVKLITGEGHSTFTPFNMGNTLVTGLSFQGEIHYSFPTLDLGPDSTICIGDSILLDAGADATSYLWSNGASTQTIYAANQGVYIATVNYCNTTITDSVSISTIPCGTFPVAALSSSDTTFCEKQCIDFFDLSTNSPTSWQWFFTGGLPDTSTLQNPGNICYNNYGSFDVMLIACNGNGCDTVIQSNFISSIQNPTDSIYQSGGTLYTYYSFVSYQWYEANTGLIAGATSGSYIPSFPGSYYVIGVDSNGCEATSNIIVITSLNHSVNPGNISLINAGNQIWQLQSENNSEKIIAVYDSEGKRILHFASNNKVISIDLASQQSGIYFITISEKEKNKISTFKIIR